MIKKKTWEDFRNCGMLWWINRILHIFGWAIVYKTENEKTVEVYPARVKFRGFSEKDETEGFIKVSKYLKENIGDIEKEARD